MFKVLRSLNCFEVGYNDNKTKVFCVVKQFEIPADADEKQIALIEADADEYAKYLNKPVTRGEFEQLKNRFS